jgi:hypothetical protein
MSLLTLGIALAVLYSALTLMTPLLLSRPKLLIAHPNLCVKLWMTSFIMAAAALTSALGIFIALALRHHVVHVSGHDTLGPLIDQLLGWLAIAVVGVLAFRMGVAVTDARTAVKTMTGEFSTVFAGAHVISVGGHEVAVVESSVPLIGARSGRVVATSSMAHKLAFEQFAIVVEHEWAHVSQHHARVIAIANIAEALAPSIQAGSGFASVARITTELIADDAAAARYGHVPTAEAIGAAYPEAPGVLERIARLRSAAN